MLFFSIAFQRIEGREDGGRRETEREREKISSSGEKKGRTDGREGVRVERRKGVRREERRKEGREERRKEERKVISSLATTSQLFPLQARQISQARTTTAISKMRVPGVRQSLAKSFTDSPCWTLPTTLTIDRTATHFTNTETEA